MIQSAQRASVMLVEPEIVEISPVSWIHSQEDTVVVLTVALAQAGARVVRSRGVTIVSSLVSRPQIVEEATNVRQSAKEVYKSACHSAQGTKTVVSVKSATRHATVKTRPR